MKHFKYIEKEIMLFEQMRAAFGGEVIPCTETEVNELESMLPKPYHLPEAYKEFLLYGGHRMADVFNGYEASYRVVKKIASSQNQEIIRMVQLEDIPDKKELPADLFVIEEVHHCGNFTYLLVTEGENPPVYFWEEGEGGLEYSRELANCFSNFLMMRIKVEAVYSAKKFMSQKIEVSGLPRGRQFWIPNDNEYTEGAKRGKLMERLGFGSIKFNEAIKSNQLNVDSYAEELSGWKAVKVGDEVRFFPPSYESPEEKEKKALELQNKIEEKKQELAKVEKRIANYQARIKNLSGGVLTGGINFFDNPSRLRIKELEKDLIKQKVLKQNLKKEITKLEDSSN